MTQATQINENLYYDERSAGGIVYRIEDGKVNWLLIKTISSGKLKRSEAINSEKEAHCVYKFPKGHLQGREFLKQAALREVEEEGKVKAKIITKIGSNNYIIWDKLKHKKIIKKVTFFLMEYTAPSNLKYYDTEVVLDREWLSYEEAREKIAYDSEKVLLRKAKTMLESLLKTGKIVK